MTGRTGPGPAGSGERLGRAPLRAAVGLAAALILPPGEAAVLAERWEALAEEARVTLLRALRSRRPR